MAKHPTEFYSVWNGVFHIFQRKQLNRIELWMGAWVRSLKIQNHLFSKNKIEKEFSSIECHALVLISIVALMLPISSIWICECFRSSLVSQHILSLYTQLLSFYFEITLFTLCIVACVRMPHASLTQHKCEVPIQSTRCIELGMFFFFISFIENGRYGHFVHPCSTMPGATTKPNRNNRQSNCSENINWFSVRVDFYDSQYARSTNTTSILEWIKSTWLRIVDSFFVCRDSNSCLIYSSGVGNFGCVGFGHAAWRL